MTAKRKPVRRFPAMHKHHLIPLQGVALIDWHLRHLWCCGWTTTVDLTPRQHRAVHRGMRVRHAGKRRAYSFIQPFAALIDASQTPGMVPGSSVRLTQGCGYPLDRYTGTAKRQQGTGTV